MLKFLAASKYYQIKTSESLKNISEQFPCRGGTSFTLILNYNKQKTFRLPKNLKQFSECTKLKKGMSWISTQLAHTLLSIWSTAQSKCNPWLTMLIHRCSELRSSLLSRRKCNAARDATGLSIAKQVQPLFSPVLWTEKNLELSPSKIAKYCVLSSFFALYHNINCSGYARSLN